MKEKLYMTEDIAILNFDLALPTTKSGLIKSEEFQAVCVTFIRCS